MDGEGGGGVVAGRSRGDTKSATNTRVAPKAAAETRGNSPGIKLKNT